MEGIDIVYPLGTGSHHKDLEIRYSLRSVQMYLAGYRDVYLIGHKPAFLTGIKHVKAVDLNQVADLNILQKLQAACQTPEISEDFLMFNDDHYLLTDFKADKFPSYYQGTMQEYIKKRGKDGYSQRVQNSMEYLQSKKLPTKYFDIHTPILINKKKFLEIFSEPLPHKRDGYVIKSIYANSLKLEGEETTDNKLTKAPERPVKVISSLPRMKHHVQRFLFERFPEPSKYEI